MIWYISKIVKYEVAYKRRYMKGKLSAAMNEIRNNQELNELWKEWSYRSGFVDITIPMPDKIKKVWLNRGLGRWIYE